MPSPNAFVAIIALNSSAMKRFCVSFRSAAGIFP
jgi:hypothetical protein